MSAFQNRPAPDRTISGLHALLSTAAMLGDDVRLAALTKAAKYLLRSLASWSTSTRWARHVLAEPRLKELARHEPHLLFRLQRPYLRTGLPRETVLRWLRDHFEWLWRNWSAEDVRAWYGERPRLLAVVADSPSGRYALQLRLAGARYCKEGELALELTLDDRPLMTAVFAVHRHEGATVLNIGCLQGVAGDGCNRIRQATRDLHGLRPKQAVLLGVRALASHYGIETILGVPNDAHIYRARRRTAGRISADYDAFWQEMGGRRAGAHFLLASRPARRGLAEIESRKRAQYRRRYALEDALWHGVVAGLPPARRG